jgi:hypothetical protein
MTRPNSSGAAKAIHSGWPWMISAAAISPAASATWAKLRSTPRSDMATVSPMLITSRITLCRSTDWILAGLRKPGLISSRRIRTRTMPKIAT